MLFCFSTDLTWIVTLDQEAAVVIAATTALVSVVEGQVASGKHLQTPDPNAVIFLRRLIVLLARLRSFSLLTSAVSTQNR